MHLRGSVRAGTDPEVPFKNGTVEGAVKPLRGQLIVQINQRLKRGDRTGLIIDAHQHFWNIENVSYPWLRPEHGAIHRTFSPTDLESQMRDAGVDGTVLVQAANSFEDTRAMLEQSNRHF